MIKIKDILLNTGNFNVLFGTQTTVNFPFGMNGVRASLSGSFRYLVSRENERQHYITEKFLSIAV